MEKKIYLESVGNLTYKESFWTGRKFIKSDKYPVTKADKSAFYVKVEDKEIYINVTGNILKGETLSTSEQENVEITKNTQVYEYLLAIINFLFVIIWGNIPSLVTTLPIVGGAIGGGISGLMTGLSLVCMKCTDKWYFKVLIGLGMFLGTLLICHILALIIIVMRSSR